MTDLTQFENDPLTLLKQLNTKVPSFLQLIELICNAAESPEQFRALLICRQALASETARFSTEQTALLNAIWIGLTSREHGISSLHSCCFLMDRLMVCPAITKQLKSNVKIINCLQTNLLAEGPNRKYVYHILRSLRDPENSSAWQSFFVIFDTLAEKQSHLIIPVLELLDRTKSLPDQWHHILLAHALTTSNNPVIRRVVQFILQEPQPIENNLLSGMIIFYNRFLNSLNTNFLYADDESFNPKWLRNYFQQLAGETIEMHLKIIFTINWKSVSLFYICESLEDVVQLSHVPRFTKLALQIPNCVLRRKILQTLSRWAKICGDEVLSLFEGSLVGTSYKSQELQMQAVCNLKLLEDIVPFVVSESLITIISTALNVLTSKYFPDLGLTDPKLIQTITQSLLHNNVWLQPLGSTSIDRVLDTLGLSKLWHFDGEISVLIAAILVHRLSSRAWSSHFVISLIDYELRTALQIFAANGFRVPSDERTSVLDSCLTEVRSPKNMHLIASFLLVLDALVANDPSFADTQRMYYEKVIQLAPNHPKWMVILSSHRPVWKFARCDTGFMISALSFGQALKGDQLIEERLCLTDASSSDCTVRNSALLQLCALSSTAHASLLQSCFDQLQQLGSQKPRYYANSETHRLKLRLVQAIAIMSSRLPKWHDQLEEMLLAENNQLNVTYIVELLVGATVEPDRLLDMIQKASTPNARRSVFMCMFYVSRQERCSANTIDKFKRTILVWTMGKDYGTRLFAQIVLLKMVKSLKVAEEFILRDTIQQSLSLVDNQTDVERLENDFRFGVDPNGLCDFVLVLHTIPALTRMCFLEIFRRDVLAKWPEFTDERLSKVSYSQTVEQPMIEPLVRTELIELNVGNVQKKIVPLKELFPITDETQQRPDNKEGLVVVASLITRAANLGGLSRTCEIFGAEKLVLDSLRHTESAEFQALSMTAEKWLRIAEVKPFHLIDYLVEMKRRGYAIIGAEQTANGISMQQLKFPKKSVLLLGHEKEGIPANLLSLLDKAVEIPQFGVVRSLNVHVTGALFIWEYAKQHNSNV